MIPIIVLQNYLVWHYTRAYGDILHIWRNLVYFLFNFFSTPMMFRTLFAPWKRIQAEREKQGFDLADYLSTKIVNVLMRLVGFFMRSILIAISFAVLGCAVVLGLAFFVLWTFLPILVFVVLSAGLTLLFLNVHKA
jgi:hypothetical protein